MDKIDETFLLGKFIITYASPETKIIILCRVLGGPLIQKQRLRKAEEDCSKRRNWEQLSLPLALVSAGRMSKPLFDWATAEQPSSAHSRLQPLLGQRRPSQGLRVGARRWAWANSPLGGSPTSAVPPEWEPSWPKRILTCTWS